jgi:carbon monoxide dehydrogenase subunit G
VHLEQSFSVPVGIDRTWQALLDIDRVAGCVPGASVESVDGGRVTGSIKIRLGTLGPTYKGVATIVDKDSDGHRAVIEAHADTRTNGTATARVVAILSEFGGSTNVVLMTELELTGRPAELDHKVISDAGDRLVKQFASRLAELLGDEAASEPPPPAPPVDTPPPDPAPEPEPAPAPAPAPEPPVEPPVEAAEEPTPQPAEEPAEEPVEQPAQEPAATEPPRRRPSPHPRPAAVLDDSVSTTASNPPDSSAAADRKAQLQRFAPIAIIVVLLLLRRRRRRRRGR